MTLTAALPKPSRATALAGARAELATLTMWTGLRRRNSACYGTQSRSKKGADRP